MSTIALHRAEGAAPELVQAAHELKQLDGGAGGGVQLWRMRPANAAASVAREAASDHDEEAFMYSGSEL